MKKANLSKKFILLLVLSVIYCLLYLGESFESFIVCLPLLWFILQFGNFNIPKKLYALLLVGTYVIVALVFATYAIMCFSNPSYLGICASLLVHMWIFTKTFDFELLENEYDFDDYPVKSFFLIVLIFAGPLLVKFLLSLADAGILMIVTILFIIAGLLTFATPFIIIRNWLTPSAFTSGSHAGEGGISNVEKVAKQVARQMTGVKVTNVRSIPRGYEISISTSFSSASEKNATAQIFMQNLANNGMDTSKISLRF